MRSWPPERATTWPARAKGAHRGISPLAGVSASVPPSGSRRTRARRGHALPRRRRAAKPAKPTAQQRLLPPAEGFAELGSRLRAARRVWAEFELAALQAGGTGLGRVSPANGPRGFERPAVLDEAGRQVRPARAFQALLARIRRIRRPGLFGEVQHDQNVCSQLLRTPVQRAPADRGRDPGYVCENRWVWQAVTPRY